ncbi:MAG: hypothetical protein WCI65_06765 [Synechococcaceae cyanobacterium ELA263]
MQISQLDPKQASQFGSSHAIHYGLADGRHVVLLSGVVSVELQSPGWVNENAVTGWFSDQLSLDIALPTGLLGDGQSFRVIESVPYLSLNTVAGVTNVGWGVNSFAMATEAAAVNSVRLNAELSVSRTGEILHCAGYHITLIGEIMG